MVRIKGFKAIRPTKELASKVAALPYDVVSLEEAKNICKENKYSFLHIDRAEVDLNEKIDLYDELVYKKAKDNLVNFIDSGVLVKDVDEYIYIYKQVMNGKSQTGIVACCSIYDYKNNKIKKHELTRIDKEQDRVNHIESLKAHTGPIFLIYKEKIKDIDIIKDKICKEVPEYEFVTDDGIANSVWIIKDKGVIKKVKDNFEKVEDLYIADGHHRAAAAVKSFDNRGKNNLSNESEYFLSVIFEASELNILDYNRVLKDLNNYTTNEVIDLIRKNFYIEKIDKQNQYKPELKHCFGMYLDSSWYKLKAKEGILDNNSIIENLDANILQKYILKPIFHINDPRTDERIEFIGGVKGLKELEKRVDNDMKVAFSMYPAEIEELIEVADNGQIMPPKSTWFEPKLLSGLFIHQI